MSSSVRTKFNVRAFGTGRQPMIFVHGLGCDQVIWRYVTPAFENDYRVILFDQVGSGCSDSTLYDKEKYASLNGYAEDLIEIATALQLKDIILVCHSVSAMIGLLAAISNSELFSRIIMVGPSPCYINDREYSGGFLRKEIEEILSTMRMNFISWAHFFAPKIIGNPERPELGEELTKSFCRTDPEITQQFAAVTFLSDNRSDLPKLKVPSLIMQCSEDVIAPQVVGEFVHRNISGSTLRVMKATGHCPQVSAPEETIQIIKEYLAK